MESLHAQWQAVFEALHAKYNNSKEKVVQLKDKLTEKNKVLRLIEDELSQMKSEFDMLIRTQGNDDGSRPCACQLPEIMHHYLAGRNIGNEYRPQSTDSTIHSSSENPCISFSPTPRSINDRLSINSDDIRSSSDTISDSTDDSKSEENDSDEPGLEMESISESCIDINACQDIDTSMEPIECHSEDMASKGLIGANDMTTDMITEIITEDLIIVDTTDELVNEDITEDFSTEHIVLKPAEDNVTNSIEDHINDAATTHVHMITPFTKGDGEKLVKDIVDDLAKDPATDLLKDFADCIVQSSAEDTSPVSSPGLPWGSHKGTLWDTTSVESRDTDNETSEKAGVTHRDVATSPHRTGVSADTSSLRTSTDIETFISAVLTELTGFLHGFVNKTPNGNGHSIGTTVVGGQSHRPFSRLRPMSDGFVGKDFLPSSSRSDSQGGSKGGIKRGTIFSRLFCMPLKSQKSKEKRKRRKSYL